MAETSGLWTTSGAPAGHQVASYTQALATDMLAITAACSGFEGVAPGYLNELAPSSTGVNNCRIATGGAMVDGKYYKNSANVDVNIPSSSGGNTRIDRVVLRATWADFDCVIERIPGTDDPAPTAPAITQTSGTTYDIQLCQVLVTAGGVITITDERKWAIVDTDESTLEDSAGLLRVKDSGITLAKMAANSVDSDQYVDGSVDPIHIANRTRKYMAIVDARDNTSGADIPRNSAIGWQLDGDHLCNCYGTFLVPQDFVSGLTVAPIWFNFGGAGNIYYKSEARYGASGEDYDTHTELGAYAAVAATADLLQTGTALSLTNASIDDIVSLNFYRDGVNGADTYNGVTYFAGFLISYTADS